MSEHTVERQPGGLDLHETRAGGAGAGHDAPGGAGAGGGAHGPEDVLAPDEVRALKAKHHLNDDALRSEGPKHGFSPRQIDDMIAGKPVNITPQQRAEVNKLRNDSQRRVPAGMDRAEALDGAWGSGGGNTVNPNLQAPTGTELSNNSIVVAAINQSWADSQVASATDRHEEGGWIYMDTNSGAITTRRAPRGQGASINLWNPPEVSGSVVVGNWHTHPNPTSEGWVPGPSGADLTNQGQRKVPGIVKADDGLHVFGATRRASLSGNAGFP